MFKLELTEHFIKEFFEVSNKKLFVLNEIIVHLSFSDDIFSLTKDISKTAKNTVFSKTESFTNTLNLTNSLEILNKDDKILQSQNIVINHSKYLAKWYQSNNKNYLELSLLNTNIIITKKIHKEIKNFERFLSTVHVDTVHKKMFLAKKVVFNDIFVVNRKKVSLIIYQAKAGYYADGFILDSRKPHHFFLGESIKPSSILSRLRIIPAKNGEKLIINEY